MGVTAPLPGGVRVLLVDDQPLLRAGFRMLLETEPDLTVVGEAGDGAAGAAEARALRPDVVLMDLRMAPVDGVEATRRIVADRANGAGPRVLVLTTFDADEHVVAALRVGASGFLLKDVEPEDLVAAVRTVARGDAVVAPRVLRRLLARFGELPQPDTAPAPPALDRLTAREREVFALAARGLSNAEIARELVLSETTVKSHVGSVLAKLGLRDRVQAVVLAYETGVVRPGRG